VRIPRAQGPARRARRAPVAAIAPRQHAAPQTTLVRDDLLADAQEARQSVGHLASMTRKKEKKKKTCLWRTWFCVTESYHCSRKPGGKNFGACALCGSNGKFDYRASFLRGAAHPTRRSRWSSRRAGLGLTTERGSGAVTRGRLDADGSAGAARGSTRAHVRRGPASMAHYSGGDAKTALMRMLDELAGDAKRSSTSSMSTAGPNSTLGIVLNGTAIDFMIPGGPAHEEEVLEPKDEILEVDGIAVDHASINQALKGADEIGSMVRLGVRKAEDGKRIDVVLKRTSLTYIHHMQVYLELMDQLRGACKRHPDLADLVRRVASKVKEMDSYHAGAENELRKSLRKFNSALPQMADLLRRTTPAGGAEAGGAGASAETQRIIDRLQYQLQVAEGNHQRLKQQLETSARSSTGGGQVYGDPQMANDVQHLKALLSEAEKDKSALQYRADQMSTELNRLKVQLEAAGHQAPTNPRLSEIR
jgi:hypothetical protein